MHLCGLKNLQLPLFRRRRERLCTPSEARSDSNRWENDAGKTAVIDALRFALGTTDQEWYRLEQRTFTVKAVRLRLRLQFSANSH